MSDEYFGGTSQVVPALASLYPVFEIQVPREAPSSPSIIGRLGHSKLHLSWTGIRRQYMDNNRVSDHENVYNPFDIVFNYLSAYLLVLNTKCEQSSSANLERIRVSTSR